MKYIYKRFILSVWLFLFSLVSYGQCRTDLVNDYTTNYLGTVLSSTDVSGLGVSLISTCTPGTLPATALTKTLNRLNFYRRLVGLNTVTFDPAMNTKAQKSALISLANSNAFTDYPDPTYACYTTDGAQASNNGLVLENKNSLDYWIQNTGTNYINNYQLFYPETPLWFRRLILSPYVSQLGFGTNIAFSTLTYTGALSGTSNVTASGYIAYPPAGYMPVQLPTYWSFSTSGTPGDFSSASVSMTDDAGNPVDVTINVLPTPFGATIARTAGISWEPDIATTLPQNQDRVYTVTIANFTKNGVPQNPYTYKVVSINPVAVDVQTTVTTPTCCTCANGTATASFTPGYKQIVWSTGATTPTVSGLASGSYTVTVTDKNDCALTKTVTIPQSATVASPTGTPSSRCGSGTITLTASGCSGTYKWYPTQTGGSLLGSGSSFPANYNTSAYSWVSCTIGDCESNRTSVLATINPIPAAPSVTSATITSGQTGTLTALGCAGTVNWYTASTGGTSLTTGSTYSSPVLTNSTTYYADCMTSGCTSSLRGVGTATIACPEPSNLFSYNVTSSSIMFTWQNAGPGQTYEFHFRKQGNVSWIPSTTVTTANLTLGGLTSATTYEWQLRIRCSDGSQSAFSPILTFTTLATLADLSLSMKVSTRTPAVNGIVSYSLTVDNQGPQSATGVQIRDILPAGLIFLDSPNASLTATNGTLLMNVGTVSANNTATVSFRATVTSPGTYLNAAQIMTSSLTDPDSQPGSGTADGQDDAATVDLRTGQSGTGVFSSANPGQQALPLVMSNQPAPGLAKADLDLSMSSSSRTLKTGTILTVTLVVSNAGSLTATGITLRVIVPANWQVLTSGWSVIGNAGTLSLPGSVLPNGTVSQIISFRVSGTGSQWIRGEIGTATQPDPDSIPGNGTTNGEDDTAIVDVRVL